MVTIILWSGFYGIEKYLDIPDINVPPVFRWGLFIIFLIDAIYLVGGSTILLIKNSWGKKLIISGPFLLVRHPLYSAIIYSGTGMLAVWQLSWALLFSAVPLAVFWSWHVQQEERFMLKKFGREYEEYINRTGQFFPSFKALKEAQGQQ